MFSSCCALVDGKHNHNTCVSNNPLPCAVTCPQAITSCVLDPEQGGYVISVETPVPLDLVLLHSQVHMDLLESNDEDDLGQVPLTFDRAPSLIFYRAF